jgi:hypothetical protein
MVPLLGTAVADGYLYMVDIITSLYLELQAKIQKN